MKSRSVVDAFSLFLVVGQRFRLAGELGFEPRFSESESDVLPLNYSPIFTEPYGGDLRDPGSDAATPGEGPIRLTRSYLANLFFRCQSILQLAIHWLAC